MTRMDGLLDALSMPYVFQHESLFVASVSVVIVVLLAVRIGLARRLRRDDHADRSGR